MKHDIKPLNAGMELTALKEALKVISLITSRFLRSTLPVSLLRVTAFLVACVSTHLVAQTAEGHVTAQALFQERCKTAGEKIYRTVEGVDGIYLIKVRPKGVNYGDQFKLDDPYGRDFDGDDYIQSFIRGSYQAGKKNLVRPVGSPPRIGYTYVEIQDAKDSLRYRYTGAIKVIGRMEANAPNMQLVLKQDPNFDLNIYRFVMDRMQVSGKPPRYGITYDDISTRPEREHWIAGSSLKVIDLQANEVIAERIGYMMDEAQGSRVGGRSPWLLAANQACPDFHRLVNPMYHEPGSSAQIWQTLDFVEKVLKPSK